jgi:sugar/nucleoside kinase (ribokinase family)
VRAAKDRLSRGLSLGSSGRQGGLSQSDRARARGRHAVALTLSDPFCVDRYRDEFLDLIRTRGVDILFANIHELKSLYQTADEATALAALRDENILGVVTRSRRAPWW